MQTFQPDHYAIRAASRHDYTGFYRQEMEQRKRLRYPPYTKLVRLEIRSANAEKAEAEARSMARQVQAWIAEGEHRGTEIIGPVPCFFGKQNSFFRWQIVLRGPNPTEVLAARMGKMLADWHIEVDPSSLL